MSDYEIRKQAKADRYRELAEKSRAEEETTLSRARELAEVIPLGQPILVGHHSEKKHRNHIDKVHNTYGKAFALGDKATYYEDKADSTENNNAISGDDPEAIAKLKAKIAEIATNPHKSVNTAANIRRLKKRVDMIEKRRQQTTTTTEVKGMTVIDNVELNRLQLIFPGKPGADMRDMLKRRGFRWAPNEGAWQRHRSNGAIYATREIRDKLKEQC